MNLKLFSNLYVFKVFSITRIVKCRIYIYISDCNKVVHLALQRTIGLGLCSQLFSAHNYAFMLSYGAYTILMKGDHHAQTYIAKYYILNITNNNIINLIVKVFWIEPAQLDHDGSPSGNNRILHWL